LLQFGEDGGPARRAVPIDPRQGGERLIERTPFNEGTAGFWKGRMALHGLNLAPFAPD
jgi:hypothetical protein